MLVAFTNLAHTILQIFSEYGVDKVRICPYRYWIATFFQIKIASFKFLKSIADDHNNCNITFVNSKNLICSIICTIIFFKIMKHNISQMLSLLSILNGIKKKFKKKLCYQ